MSDLLAHPPYSERRDAALLAEMNAVTTRHLERSELYRRIWPDWRHANSLDEIPYLHAGTFKHLPLTGETKRVLVSSGTAGSQSRIAMDAGSGQLQRTSSEAILADFIGDAKTPLLILDSSAALRAREAIPARIAAAMALYPFASETHFVLGPNNAIDWQRVAAVIHETQFIRLYAITSLLWTEWLQTMPPALRESLRKTRIDFVHSGGWKKLEALRVDRATLERTLLEPAGEGSRVVDFYGLVEQNGVIFPLCEAGFRHAPLWSEVIVRDPFTMRALRDEEGLLQLMNPLSRSTPSHSVLTEDLGRLVPGDCSCGRLGRRFELLGRLPQAEIRGCANV